MPGQCDALFSDQDPILALQGQCLTLAYPLIGVRGGGGRESAPDLWGSPYDLCCVELHTAQLCTIDETTKYFGPETNILVFVKSF